MAEHEIRTEFIKANGLEFEVDMCGEGQTLALCLHGFPEHSFSFRHQLPLLASLGYKAWAPNLRGYGRTSRPKFMEDYSIENLMDDVAGLIDASETQSTVLIAHDWGAVIAWFFAMREVRPLSKLVILNVPHPVPMQRAFRGFKQLFKSWYILFFQLPFAPEFLLGMRRGRGVADVIRNSAVDKSRFPDDVVKVYQDNVQEPGALTAMINYYRALVRGGGARRQARLGYPVITVPTLMIWGEEDVALAKETTYGTEEFVADFTIRYLPRVSHWVQQEAPDAVNAMIEAFLSGSHIPEARWRLELDYEGGDK